MIFNHLPSGINDLSNNVKSFKSDLKNFLLANVFYPVDKFLSETNKRFWLGINLLYKQFVIILHVNCFCVGDPGIMQQQ
jgi:hypothetical protein